MIFLFGFVYLLITIFLYMLGGQTQLWMRRWILPVIQSGLTYILSIFLNLSWVVLLPPLIDMVGFDIGDKKELLKGAISGIPIIIGIIIFHTNWWLLILYPIVTFSYLPDFPSLGKIGKYDILGRDLFRSSIGSVCWLLVVFLK